jgi:hypothetical protein
VTPDQAERSPPWLEVIEIAPGEDPPADGFERIYAHALGGVILRGSVPPDVIRVACERLARLELPASVRVAPVVSRGAAPILEVLGRSLRLSPWAEYVAALEPIRRIHAELFGHPDGIEPLLRARIARLCRGMEPAPLVGAAGQPFARCLVSTLREGGTLPFHFDNYCLYEPTEFTRVAPILEPETLVNALTILQAPERGGVLELAAFDWDEYRARTGLRDSSAWSDALIEGRLVRRIELGAGDTLVFDAGRIAHRVTPVGGARARCSVVWHMGILRGSNEIRTFV